MLIKEKFKKNFDFHLQKKRQKTKMEHKIDNKKLEHFYNRNIVRDLENDNNEWEIECKNRTKHNVKVKDCAVKPIRRLFEDKIIKHNFSMLSNSKLNIYQKLYKILSTKQENWEHISFLSSKEKRERMCETIEQEIVFVKSKRFNFDKYKTSIYLILNLKNKTFPDIIVKNMYIAKLQNISFLIKEIDSDDNKIEEVEEHIDIYR